MKTYRVTANVVHKGVFENGLEWESVEQLPCFEIEASSQVGATEKALDILGRSRIHLPSLSVVEV